MKPEEDDIANTESWNASTLGGGVEALFSLVKDKWKLDLTLEMLQKDGLVNTIASPMIVAAQNSEAQITSGFINVPMFSDIEVVSQNTQSVQTGTDPSGNPIYETRTVPAYTTPKYETVDLIGTRLRVTPQINQDRSVTLRVYLSQSGVDKSGAEIQYATFNSEGMPNSSWTKTDVDTQKTQLVQTIAAVPEGFTLALGGLIEEEESVIERKVPVMGDIPLIGFFFKNENKVKNRREMIFLLTPHILMSPGEAGRVTEEALEGSEHPVIKEDKKNMFEYNETWKKLHKNKK
jgi:general secretion pathway protein D